MHGDKVRDLWVEIRQAWWNMVKIALHTFQTCSSWIHLRTWGQSYIPWNFPSCICWARKRWVITRRFHRVWLMWLHMFHFFLFSYIMMHLFLIMTLIFSHWEWCWRKRQAIGWRRLRCGGRMPSTRWSGPCSWEWLWLHTLNPCLILISHTFHHTFIILRPYTHASYSVLILFIVHSLYTIS